MYNKHDPKVLPMRDGVRPSCVVLPNAGKGLVIDFLSERLPMVSREDWKRRMHAANVCDEFGDLINPDSLIIPGIRIYYYREPLEDIFVPFQEEVIFQDEHLLVVDKPHFLPVNPGGNYLQNSLLVRLRNKLKIEEISPIHRIDRETAGLVIFSLKKNERGIYQSLFRDRKVVKFYEAIAGVLPDIDFPYLHESRLESEPDSIRMKEVFGEKNSCTKIDIISQNEDFVHYSLSPVTGKRHQLRVHLASLGIPIFNDRLYGKMDMGNVGFFEKPLQLLAKKISFYDPIAGRDRLFESKRKLEIEL